MGQSVEQSELKSYSTTSGLRNSLDSSFETTGNPPAPQITCSDFGEGSCGEPLLAQHLVIDFSPTEELDNDVVQKKCCAFWKFIRSNPELQTMMKDAKPNHYANTSVSSHNTYQEENVELIKEPEVRETTAVSMLEFVEKKGLIDRTFEARLPQPLCSLGTREYPEDDNPSNHVLVPEYASPAVENLVTAIHTPRQKYKFYARRCASGTMNIQSQWNLRDILQLSATVSCKEIPTLDGIHILAYLHYFATILSSVFTLLLYNVIILIIYSIILLLFI
ncbi:uncharacterized protein LOC116413544 isoform X1 [Galleria mellonella]|uniref:Uncharacterized protein LOC116413544 isoform X1 n=1 Tax=Galleria mellonella TaxID=7137 RepID=A0ABM3N790_GALME|nr:uncharacterized protein LOC116413544 isoform X1 [Galleria mellonella]